MNPLGPQDKALLEEARTHALVLSPFDAARVRARLATRPRSTTSLLAAGLWVGLGVCATSAAAALLDMPRAPEAPPPAPDVSSTPATRSLEDGVLRVETVDSTERVRTPDAEVLIRTRSAARIEVAEARTESVVVERGAAELQLAGAVPVVITPRRAWRRKRLQPKAEPTTAVELSLPREYVPTPLTDPVREEPAAPEAVGPAQIDWRTPPRPPVAKPPKPAAYTPRAILEFREQAPPGRESPAR